MLGKNISRSDSSIPWNLRLAIWNDGKVIRSMAESLSEKYHVGKSDLSNIYLPYLAAYFKNRPEALEEFLKQNEFDDSERRVMMKLRQRSDFSMKISPNKWFRLPQLGKDVFSDLMKAKVKYDTKFGFQFTSATNVPRALSVLTTALHDDVELARACFICDNPLDDETSLDSTICSSCLGNEDAFDLYKMKFAKLMETA